MRKIITLFCFAFAIFTCLAQKTKTFITGIDAIRLGDSINRVNTYGFPFIAVKKFNVSDSFQTSSAWEPKNLISLNELKEESTSIRSILIDSGKTFCPDVSIFITNNFNINQIQHSKTAIMALTYFKKILIEIRIIDSAKYIRTNYSYGLKKYGKGFAEQLDGYILHDQARSRATNPNAKMLPPKNWSKVPIATIAKELSEHYHLESIYWVNGNYSFAFNYCSYPYNFWVEKHLPKTQISCSYCGCEEEAITIKNIKAYEAMKNCSDKTLKQLTSK